MAHKNYSLIVSSPVCTIKKDKNYTCSYQWSSCFVICNIKLHPCPWEVVLSGFAVANLQVSLNSSSVEGMKWTCFRSELLDYWKIMCTKNNAVTKLRYSLKQWGKSNRRLTRSLRIISLKGKGAVSLFFQCCCCHLSLILCQWFLVCRKLNVSVILLSVTWNVFELICLLSDEFIFEVD